MLWKLNDLSIYIVPIICHNLSEIACIILKLWSFIWMCVGVYGARPNVIRYIFGEGIIEVFASNLFM